MNSKRTNNHDTADFIRFNALRLKVAAKVSGQKKKVRILHRVSVNCMN